MANLSRRSVLAQATCVTLGAGLAACVPVAARANSGSETGFQISYVAGGRDPAGRFMGGTEMRLLAAHMGKLFAGSGYWEDQPGLEGPSEGHAFRSVTCATASPFFQGTAENA